MEFNLKKSEAVCSTFEINIYYKSTVLQSKAVFSYKMCLLHPCFFQQPGKYENVQNTKIMSDV